MEVWVLLINHSGGLDFSVHRTEESACAALDSYVNDWWESADIAEKPEDPKEACRLYFAAHQGDEWFEIAARDLTD